MLCTAGHVHLVAQAVVPGVSISAARTLEITPLGVASKSCLLDFLEARRILISFKRIPLQVKLLILYLLLSISFLI